MSNVLRNASDDQELADAPVVARVSFAVLPAWLFWLIFVLWLRPV